VNTGRQDLVTFFVYPGHAGHDYGTIERQGFRKLIVEREGRPTIVDNPRWRASEKR
jgi:glucose-6-phosphate isomerase